MEGYNISLKVNNKTLVGRTQEDLTISAVVKESLTKDDQGAKKKTVVSHDISFKVAGLVDVTAGQELQKLNRDDLIALSLLTGPLAVVTVEYVCAGGATYTGGAIITGYSESSSADASNDATYSLDLASTGTFTKSE